MCPKIMDLLSLVKRLDLKCNCRFFTVDRCTGSVVFNLVILLAIHKFKAPLRYGKYLNGTSQHQLWDFYSVIKGRNYTLPSLSTGGVEEKIKICYGLCLWL